MNFKALIVEDEINNAKFLNYLVDSYSPSIEVIGIAINLIEAKKLIARKHPDIIFLDIELGKNNGFEIFDTFDPEDFQIIFTTAYDDYAIDAIKISVVDYLIKPIDIEEFISGTQKAIMNLKKQTHTVYDNVETLYQKNRKLDEKVDVISIPIKNEVHIVKLNSICYFSSHGKYTNVNLLNGQELLSCTNIGNFEKITDPNTFIRIHHSYMVNLHFLKKVVKGEGYYCVMENGKSLPISRRKYPILKSILHI